MVIIAIGVDVPQFTQSTLCKARFGGLFAVYRKPDRVKSASYFNYPAVSKSLS